MTNKTLPTLSAGGAIASADLFISRQGADTEDKKVTGAQLLAFLNASVSRLAAIPSGRFLTPANFGGLSNTSMQAGRVNLVPILVPRTMTFTDFGFSTVAVTAMSAKIGIYASNALGFPTGNPIAGTTATIGPYTTAALTAQAHTYGSPFTLPAGLYYLAMVTDVSGTVSCVNNTGQPNIFGAPDMSSGNGTQLYYAGSYAAGLVDLTAVSFSYGAGLGSFYLGLKAQ